MNPPSRFLLFWARCRSCGHEWKTLSDPGDGRYRILLGGANNSVGYVDTIEDSAFSEVYRLVEQALGPDTPLADRLDAFDGVFGLICDMNPDGSHFDMSGKRRCIRCGSTSVDFGPTEPPEYAELIPVQVTHERWDNLTEKQKHKEILERLAVLRKK